MMISRLIKTGEAVRVLEWNDDGTIIHIVSADKVHRSVPRSAIETPVECCDRCGLPAQTVSGNKPSCPDHVKHEVQDLLQISADKKKYNRVTRRKASVLARRKMKLWFKIMRDRKARGYKPPQPVKFEGTEIQPCVAMPSPTRTKKTGRTMPTQG